ncbi:hypothetical protein NFJ02_01g38440 [Pycnococcus provasolii]
MIALNHASSRPCSGSGLCSGSMRTRHYYPGAPGGARLSRRSRCFVRAARNQRETKTAQAAPPPAQPSLMDTVKAQPALAAAAVAAALAALAAVLRAMGSEGSVESIRDRGVMRTGNVARVDDDGKAMRNVNKVKAPELSEDAIMEARRRRARDLKATDDLAGMDIPDNHPWAEKKDVNDEDIDEIRQRLKPTDREKRRGL